MKFKLCAALLSLFFFCGTALAAPKFTLTQVFSNFTFERPLDFQKAPKAFADSVFIVEQGGKIFRVKKDGSERLEVLNIANLISRSGSERGLLGLAFHPRFARNGFFFVNYTRESDGATVISRFTFPAGSTVADPASEKIFLVVAQPFANHNGGGLAFGFDKFLYIALGDGGSGGDPQNNAQNRQSLLGKILRIDVDKAEDGNQYAIPASNPYKGNKKGFLPEIFTYGMRNPFKISVDSKTGRIWAGDVGQGAFEEIDIIERGGNYGWKIIEGPVCYPSGESCAPRGFKKPVFSYPRSQGASVTGGYVYRGSALRSLKGKGAYIYGDFISGNIWYLTLNNGKARNRLIAESGLNVSSFGQDQRGEVYVVSYDGRVFKIT